MGMLLRRHYEARARLEQERMAQARREADLKELRREPESPDAAPPPATENAPESKVESAPAQEAKASEGGDYLDESTDAPDAPAQEAKASIQQKLGTYRHAHDGKKKHRR